MEDDVGDGALAHGVLGAGLEIDRLDQAVEIGIGEFDRLGLGRLRQAGVEAGDLRRLRLQLRRRGRCVGGCDGRRMLPGAGR
jgi:hypothetical protein